MTAAPESPPTEAFTWNIHDLHGTPLNLGVTLASGQSFRWRRDEQAVWWGVIENVVAALWQPPNQPDAPLHWQTFPERDQWAVLADYFRLDVNLDDLYAQWTQAEPSMTPAVRAFRGLRVLRQPPIECFFAFQCATCNTVTKIERSIHKLAARYGQPLMGNREQGIGNSDSKGGSAPYTLHPTPYTLPFHAFPTVDALACADESALRADLWGYRAPRVIALARHLQSLPPGWLESLRGASYAEAHAALAALPGIGAKIADCICLFCLDKDGAVPVDTHVRQIAARLFLPELVGKSLTPRAYAAIADSYRDRFGAWAGWAQQYLFFADLHRARDFAATPIHCD